MDKFQPIIPGYVYIKGYLGHLGSGTNFCHGNYFNVYQQAVVPACCGWLFSLSISNYFSVRSTKELLMFQASSKQGVKVKSLVYASDERKVYVVLDNGG